eukprot:scaffold290824_cov28-Attheya_sp.AAC.1
MEPFQPLRAGPMLVGEAPEEPFLRFNDADSLLMVLGFVFSDLCFVFWSLEGPAALAHLSASDFSILP